MKPLLWFLTFIVVAVAGAIAALPFFIDEEGISRIVQERVRDRFGPDLTLDGGLSLRLYPAPVLSLHDVHWTTTLKSGAPVDLHASRVDLGLSLLPLLQGRMGLQRLTLVQPDIELGQFAPMDILGTVTGAIARAEDVTRVTVEDGQIRAPLDLNVGGAGQQDTNAASPLERQFLLDSVDLDLRLDPTSGIVDSAGSLRFGGQRMTVDLSTVRPSDRDTSLPFRGRLRADLGGLDLQFDGTAADLPSGFNLKATIDSRTSSLADALLLIQPLLDDTWSDVRFPAVDARLRTRLDLSPDGWRFDDIALVSGTTTVAGQVVLPQARPELDMQLDIAALDLADGHAVTGLLQGPIGQAAGSIPSRGTLHFTNLGYRGQAVRDLRTSFAWDTRGKLAVDGLQAILPGNSRLDLTGTWASNRFAGRVGLSTADLRALLAWQHVGLPALPDTRLRLATIEGSLTAERGSLHVDDARLRIDASQGTGSLAIDYGDHPSIAASMKLDRLAAESYLSADTAMSDSDAPGAAGPAAGSASWQLQLDLAVDRLSWNDIQLGPARLQGSFADHAAKLNMLAMDDLVGTRLSIAAQDAAATVHRVTATVAQPARLASALGYPRLAEMLATARRIEITGQLRQQDDQTRVQLAGTSPHWRMTMDGSFTRPFEGGAFTAAFDLHAPETARMFDEIGFPVAALDAHAPLRGTPFVGELRLSRPAAEQPVQLAGKIAMGQGDAQTRLTATLALAPSATADDARPRTTGDLRLEQVGPAMSDMLQMAAASVGLPTGPPAAWVGSWPTSSLNVDWQDMPSLDLRLTGPAIRGQMTLSPAGLDVGDLRWSGLGGQLAGSLRVAPGNPGLGATADLSFEGVQANELFAMVQAGSIIDGPLTLRLAAHATGGTVAELVGSLNGQATVVGLEGKLAPSVLPPPADETAAPAAGRLSGTLALDRGIATLSEGKIELGDETLPVAARIDLPAWAMEASVGDRHFTGTPLRAYPR